MPKSLTDDQDAFGHAVWDHYHGMPAFEIIERSDGLFAISGGPAMYLSEPASWTPHERQVLERHARGRVLDIGCNAGRHALYLQQEGLDVLGVDVSPLSIAVAKKRGLANAKVLSIDELSPKLGGRMSGQIRMRARYKRFVTPWFDYLMVSPEEMEGLVAGTGWRIANQLQAGARFYTAIIERAD